MRSIMQGNDVKALNLGGGADVFARKSSGLVRAASTYDASLVNLYTATFPIMVSFLLGVVLPFYAGANVYLTLLIALGLSLPILVSYAVASSVMRRSGGDYVFISRLLHPAVGFAANFAFVAFQAVFLTSSGYYFCQWCLAPLARLIGANTGSTSWLNFANDLTKPLAIFLVSELFVVVFALIFIFRNTRSVLRIFRYTLPLSGIGLLAYVIAMLMNSHAELSAHFDTYVAHAGGHANAVAIAAKTSGFSVGHFSMAATFLAITWPAFSIPYYLGSAYFAGEVRSAKRAQLLAGPATAVVAVVGSLLLIWVTLGRMGAGTVGSILSADPTKLGLPTTPTYMEVAAGSSGNVGLGVLILLGFGSWLIPTVPMSLLIMTRCMFGWSMDRVAPSGLAKVSYRTNSPWVAVLVVALISAVVSYFWAYSSQLTVVVGAFPQVITLTIGCLAAAFIPWRQRALYETAPIRGYFGRVPRLTVVALLGVIGGAVMVWNFARDPSSGVDPSNHPGMFWTSLAFFPAGFVLYYLAVLIRRWQGIDLSLAFREIPPD